MSILYTSLSSEWIKWNLCCRCKLTKAKMLHLIICQFWEKKQSNYWCFFSFTFPLLPSMSLKIKSEYHRLSWCNGVVMHFPTHSKPVSFSHYMEFLHLSSQMGLKLKGTAGLSQPILGLSCCCRIPPQFRLELQRGQLSSGTAGKPCTSFGAEEALDKMKEP